MKQLFFLFIGLVLLQTSCWRGSVLMKVPLGWGGRAVSLTLDPNNENNVWVATPTGGLFSSGVAGAYWGHSDAFPEFNCISVKFSPADSSVIIATCIEDSKVVNGGGIWVSTNAGKSWTHPPTSIPATGRISAFAISFMPGTRNVFVGTNFGLAVSLDLGSTWQFIN